MVTLKDPVTHQEVVSDAFASAGLADPLSLPASAARIAYQYQPDGELLSLTNRLNNTWTMLYDGQGRLQSQTTPNQRATGYTYTADGKVATLTRPDGSVITHTYYPQSGKLWKQTDAMGTLEHKYDIAGNLVSSSDGTHTLRYAYDLQSRLTRFTDKNGDQTVYTYYPNSLLKSVQYRAQSAADTVTVSYAYHPDRSLKSVTDWEGRVTRFAYYQNGSLRSIHRPNGTKRAFGYTAAGELESLAETRPGDAAGSGALLYFCKFGYNARGQLEQRHVFPADPATATRSPAMSAVANADNQLASVNGATQSYDLRGNTQIGRKPDGSSAAEYQFDARNRLESLTGSASYGFGYDLSDTRVRVTEGSQVTEFGVAPLGGMSQVLTEKRPGPGNVVKTYVYTPNGQLLYEVETSTVSAASTVEDEETGETFAVAGGSPARYFHYDMTGSKDLCGAYGVQTDASGLVHMRARYCHPHLCRCCL